MFKRIVLGQTKSQFEKLFKGMKTEELQTMNLKEQVETSFDNPTLSQAMAMAHVSINDILLETENARKRELEKRTKQVK